MPMCSKPERNFHRFSPNEPFRITITFYLVSFVRFVVTSTCPSWMPAHTAVTAEDDTGYLIESTHCASCRANTEIWAPCVNYRVVCRVFPAP
jgi:hypothetical protein